MSYAQHFLDYLVDSAFLSKEEAQEIETHAEARSSRLGRMLLRERVVTMKQMAEVVRLLPTSGQRIGDLVVSLGFATRRDVERVAARQPTGRSDRYDLLLEQGVLDREELLEAMVSFLRQLDEEPVPA